MTLLPNFLYFWQKKEQEKITKKPFLAFLILDDVIMIIANDQFLCFCYKRKDMLLIRILMVIKR